MCFTRYCHGAHNSGDMIELVEAVKGCPRRDAIEWLKSFIGIEGATPEINAKLRAYEILKPREVKCNKVFDDDLLNQFQADKTVENSYYRSRGYNQKTLNYFDVRYCFDKDSNFYNRAIIPVHDRLGNLIGVSGRWMGDHKADKTNKFYHMPGMRRNLTLYNWHRAQKYLDCGYVIVVEGPGAVWSLHEIGVFNVVAILGTAFSDDQAKILTSNPKIDTVVLCMDGDEAGRVATHKVADILSGKINLQIMKIPEGLDLDKIDAEQFQRLYASRKNFALQGEKNGR